jgi:hypothetical protein
MKTFPTVLVVLTLSLAFSACQNDETVNEPQPPQGDLLPGSNDKDLTQDYLAELYEFSDSIDYDTIEGDAIVGLPCTVSGSPDSWGEDYVFSITFPSGALSGPPGRHIPITIRGPIYAERYEHAVYMLEPDDLELNSDVTVTLCYPPWLTAKPNYRKFCFFRLENPPYYGFSDEEILASTLTLGGAIEVTFDTDHFSRWALEDDK